MSDNNQTVLSVGRPTLALSGFRAYALEFLLIGAAVVLPLAAHLTGAPVRTLLPMHWPVILAGLIYGWRGGALAGILAPIGSYLISGFPLPVILPSMTLELIAYGFVTGALRERTNLNAFFSVAIALIAGRVVFIASVLLGVAISDPLSYFQAALLPGLFAALGQIALLPLLARWWVKGERRETPR